MRRTGALLGSAAAVLAFAGLAAAEPGDVILTGTTTEGAKVKLTIGTAGNATAFKVGKTKVTCQRGGTLSNDAGTYADLDRSDPGAFSDRRSDSSSSGGNHFKTKSKLSGRVDAGGTAWTGSLMLSTKVFKHDHKVDTCKLKTAWTAS